MDIYRSNKRQNVKSYHFLESHLPIVHKNNSISINIMPGREKCQAGGTCYVVDTYLHVGVRRQAR